MGLNRLMLEQQDPRTWRGQAMLPVCSNGRTDWRITVEIDDGHRYMSDFFTVVTP
ncbi:MAG: hypothetical protein HC808_14545 [Candidatus Competibacteraceae bacterium]|nr:hypothetical protein [Candidatus Competibacteraceae bacterium]